MEQNDERAVQRARYMMLETMTPLRDTAFVSLPNTADSPQAGPAGERDDNATLLHHIMGHNHFHEQQDRDLWYQPLVGERILLPCPCWH